MKPTRNSRFHWNIFWICMVFAACRVCILGDSEVPGVPDFFLHLSDVDLGDILHHEPCHWDEIAQGYLLGKGTMVLSAELFGPGSMFAATTHFKNQTSPSSLDKSDFISTSPT